jgi:hypothetical protein
MPSVLSLVSLGFVLGAAVVGVRWSVRRQDSLGRPRSFPAWSMMLLLALALAAAVPAAKRRVQEHQLASVASRLVGHDVTVHCQSTAGALVDAGAELGYVPYDANGIPRPTTTLKRDPCRDLRRYLSGSKDQPTIEQVTAVHVLTHEAMHMRGETSEAVAECEALQRDAQTASMLGANARQARHLARSYWLLVYPQMPDDYRTGDCRQGGPLDEDLASAPWA